MRILNYLRLWYYSLLLRLESSKISTATAVIRQQDRKNEKLARGVKHLVRYLRGMTDSERKELTNQDNILMRAGRSKDLSVGEKLQQTKAMAKLISGPKEEGEDAMAKTFVRNQGKYKLQSQKRSIYKDLQSGKMQPKEAEMELRRINNELKKYEH